jgi:hypothetical protein
MGSTGRPDSESMTQPHLFRDCPKDGSDRRPKKNQGARASDALIQLGHDIVAVNDQIQREETDCETKTPVDAHPRERSLGTTCTHRLNNFHMHAAQLRGMSINWSARLSGHALCFLDRSR